jgi:NADPH-dependent 2,4-dienoyl-CoA reductase/sulfur reductase-like enzyme
MDDGLAVHEGVTGAARSAVVVGAGYIGVEMADALVHRGFEVTPAGRAPSVLLTLDAGRGALLAEELRRHGVDVATGVTLERVDAVGDRLAVSGTAGFRRLADLVVVAVGVRPDTALARTAGVRLGAGAAVEVDRRMRTGVDGVHAAGDCVHTWHRLLRRPVSLPLGTTSHKQGRVAGENAVGGTREFAGSLGTQVVKAFGLAAARTGLRDPEARAAGFDPVTVETAVDDHKRHYPGAVTLRIRVTGDRRDGRLLGAHIVGPVEGQVAKRIDVYATALHHGMAVDGIDDLDLAYMPPFAAPWDAVQTAAQAWGRAGVTAPG